MEERSLRYYVPISHTFVGLAGWGVFAFYRYTAFAVVAGALSLFVLPRYFRGPVEEANEKFADFLRKPVEPSKRAAKALYPGEMLIAEMHQHPMCIFWWWFGGFFGFAIAVALGMLLPTQLPSILIAMIVGVVLTVRVIIWRHDKVCLTNKRILAVRGWTDLKVEFMPLVKMANESLRVPAVSRLLAWARWLTMAYGTIIADAAGEEDLLGNMSYVPGAEEVNILIANRVLGD